MADCDHTAVVKPDGNLCKCDQIDDFYSHIESQDQDRTVIDSWKELRDELPECDDCFYYSDCVRLKKCTTAASCNEHSRAHKYQSYEKLMEQELELWKKTK